MFTRPRLGALVAAWGALLVLVLAVVGWESSVVLLPCGLLLAGLGALLVSTLPRLRWAVGIIWLLLVGLGAVTASGFGTGFGWSLLYPGLVVGTATFALWLGPPLLVDLARRYPAETLHGTHH